VIAVVVLVGLSVAAAIRYISVDVPTDGLAAELLASAKANDILGVPLAADGTFTVPNLADGPWRLQLRSGATVLSERAIMLVGSLDLGDWVVGPR
jgi:hypothetical protein